MTPAQQAALEALVWRGLSEGEIASLDLLIAARNDDEIARQLSVDRTRRVPTEIGNGLILETIGLTSGNTLLDVLAAQSEFRHVTPLLEQGRLRVDSGLVRLTLDTLAANGVITVAEAAALKALAEQPDPVSVSAVSEALNG